MKKLMLSLLIAMIMVFPAIAGGSGESAGGAGPYKVMFSTENGSEDIESKALYEIRDILNESGLFDCEVFIGGALGTLCAGVGWDMCGWGGVCLTGALFATLSLAITIVADKPSENHNMP